MGGTWNSAVFLRVGCVPPRLRGTVARGVGTAGPCHPGSQKRGRASGPPTQPTRAPAGKWPYCLIGAPGLAGRASQITAWLGFPRAATPSSGYHALPETGPAPDKGSRSACPGAEPTAQGLLGAEQDLGNWGSPGTRLGARQWSPGQPTSLAGGGAPFLRGCALGKAHPMGECKATAGAWLSEGNTAGPQPRLTQRPFAVHNVCNCPLWPW